MPLSSHRDFEAALAFAASSTEHTMDRLLPKGDSDEARVSEWMTQHPETIDASDETDHAASLMIHGGFRHLPVMEGDHLLGMVSIRDLSAAVRE